MTLRWALKRGLKWSVEWATALSGAGWLYRRTAAFQEGVRILTYHRVAREPNDSYTVRTRHFQSHMAFLADHYRPVALSSLVKDLISGAILDPHTVAITFDDGYAEGATFVREILEQYGIPATFLVVTAFLDQSHEPHDGPFMSWDELRGLAAAGFEIGSHTVTHRSLGQLTREEVEAELAHSRQRLTDELGHAPEGLSYPYGTVRDFSAAIAQQARQAGYGYAVTAIHGLNHAGCDPFVLRRTSLMAGDGLRTFRLVLNGNLDPWVLVDRWGYRAQRVYDVPMEREGL
ncbi:MAG: polysaccharide deacetylase family protein [Thermodesulfobacteriota bacterium]